jgi:hypothetical protein
MRLMGLGIKSNADLDDVRISLVQGKKSAEPSYGFGLADCKEFFLRPSDYYYQISSYLYLRPALLILLLVAKVIKKIRLNN